MLKVKPFLFILFLTVFVAFFITGCSDTGSSSGSGGGNYDNTTTNPGGDTENPSGGGADKSGVTAIDLAGNPFSLLGVYNVTLYGIDGEPVDAPLSKSELRVGLNLENASGGAMAPEVLMSLDFEGKKISFDKYIIDLSSLASAGGDLNKFIADTFANLGAELIEGSEYGLYFTLDPAQNPQYSSILDNLIIQNGQYLKLKLDKTKDLTMDSGLGDNTENPNEPDDPANPEEPVTVPVERVTISGQPVSVVHGGAPFKLTAVVFPNNAANKVVTWTSSHPDYISVDNQGNVTIKGYVEETITITASSTADKTKTDSYQFNIEKAAVTDISVIPAEMTLTLRKDGSTVSANITTAIEPAIATDYTTVSYNVTSGQDYITVDSKGVVTAVKEGSAVVTVTAVGLTKTVTVTVNPAPTVEIPVTNITVTTSADTVYKKGINVAVNFTLTPANTTDTMVSYSMQSRSGNISTANGSGTLEITNVQGGETITFTTIKGQQATYTINAVDGIQSLSFVNDTITVEQTNTGSNELNNKEEIQNSSSSITYESLTTDLASVDSSTGVVTGLKNGLATIKVTVQPKYESTPLTAEYKVDVLGYIDYTDENSLQGTYDIVFFGTNTNNSGLAKGVIAGAIDSAGCSSIYDNFKWNNTTSCGTGTAGYSIPAGNFAGKATVQVNDSGIISVITKVGFIGSNTIQSMSKADQYQYTIYPEVSLSSYLNTANTGNLTGRTLSDKSTSNDATYYFERDVDYSGKTDKDLVVFTTISKKAMGILLKPDTRLVLRKTSSQVETMNPNSLDEVPFDKLKGSLTLSSNGNI